MARLKENVSLLPHNTFGLDATARWWFPVSSREALIEFVIDNANLLNKPWLVLGGGSNLLFTQDYNGLILYNQIKGKEVVREDETQVWLRTGSGENWHELVRYCLDQGWGGIENLSLIPGSVGAAPIQNIGAYGVELKEVFESLEAIHLATGIPHQFGLEDCHFGYRESVFKRQARGRFFITHLTLRLSKQPTLNLAYGSIREELARMGVEEPGIREVSEAVCNIRRSKLPNPAVTGNAGSFFKNPTLSQEQFEALQQQYPDIPAYPLAGGQVKVPAAWLIDTAGWKGKRFGNCGVHDKQALVLVNHGGASGKEILELSKRIMKSILDTFGIELEREVNVVG
jgi:UDP-N-acetylmuramate dehydrogenase